jgi:hypothetical protein
LAFSRVADWRLELACFEVDEQDPRRLIEWTQGYWLAYVVSPRIKAQANESRFGGAGSRPVLPRCLESRRVAGKPSSNG